MTEMHHGVAFLFTLIFFTVPLAIISVIMIVSGIRKQREKEDKSKNKLNLLLILGIILLLIDLIYIVSFAYEANFMSTIRMGV